MRATTLLALGACAASGLNSFAQYSTGFEAPTFSSGSTINAQDSWTSTTPDRARILTDAEISTELTTLGITPGQTTHNGTQAALCLGNRRIIRDHSPGQRPFHRE